MKLLPPRKMASLALGWIFLSVGLAEAAFVDPTPHEPFNVFYTIPEEPVRAQSMGFEDPTRLVLTGFSPSSAMDGSIRLLNFRFHNQRFPPPAQPYDRLMHFGTWVDDPRDRNCLDTRAKVLVRDSVIPARSGQNECFIERGEWRDPYAGKVYQLAEQVHIDHVVALKNAYISGAHRWPWKFRCLYANFLGNKFHLLAVDGPENLRKSDKTPADWMPMNRGYACQHLENWLKIKLIWGLVLGEREAKAIATLVRSQNCDQGKFQMSERDLRNQRNFIQSDLSYCATAQPGPRPNPNPAPNPTPIRR